MSKAANVPPLTFKYFQGGIIDISPDSKAVQVRRLKENSDIGVVFSTRAVGINEKICFRFKKTTGSIRYGFSRDDPGILNVAPSTVSASKFFQSPGWTTRLSRKSSKLDDIWYYYVDSTGDVHIARNGQDEIVHFSKVNANGPLWAIILIDRDTALEFVDPKAARVGPPARRTRRQLVLGETVNATSYGAEDLCFQNLSGRGVILSEDYPISQYSDMSTNIMYSNRPMMINEMICLSFSDIDCNIKSTIDFGFTRCDSESTDWVVTLERDLFKQGNILHFFVNSSGDIQYGVNGKDIKQICFGIDTSISFWATVQFHYNCTLILNDSVRLLRQWVSDKINETGPAAMQAILSTYSHEQVCSGQTLSENQATTSQQTSKVQARTVVNSTQQEVTSKSHQTKKRHQTNAIPASSSTNQTPLRFHSVHGENIEVSNGGSRVHLCEEDGMGGIAFSARPIRTNEAIFFRIIETSFEISFGFTRYDPVEHAVPDTIAFQTCLPPGYWVSCLEEFSKRDNIWYFYVSSSGDIHIGVNGKDVRVYFAELYFHDNDHWAFVEIWGDTVLEFVDPPAARVGPPAQRTPQDVLLTTTATATCPGFYMAHGEQVKVSNDGFTLQSPLSQNHKKGRAFSNRPIKLNEMIHILFVNVSQSSNFIDFGFTNHNPTTAATLNTLSDYKGNEKNQSKTTSGYWMTDLKQDYCVTGNILHFHVNDSGAIQYGINGTNLGIICAGVETLNPLWAVVQLCPNNNTIQFVHYRNGLASEGHSAVKNVGDAFMGLNIGQSSAEDTDTEQNKATSRQPSVEPSAPQDPECIICTMEDANTAFSCGHICTCYECAKEVWQGSGNGRCPICRAKITQILRTYR